MMLIGIRQALTDMQKGLRVYTVKAGVGLSAAQLANQARLRCREAIMKFYDGSLVSDDELHPVTTRNICLRTQVRLASPHCPNQPEAPSLSSLQKRTVCWCCKHAVSFLDPIPSHHARGIQLFRGDDGSGGDAQELDSIQSGYASPAWQPRGFA